jgi:hypothetical protein
MIVSELNYLEVVNDETKIVGGIINQSLRDIRRFFEKVDIEKNIEGDADVSDNLGFSEADALAFGDNALTNSLTQTFVTDFGSRSTATSASAVD